MTVQEDEDGDYVYADEADIELKVKNEDGKGDRFGGARPRNDNVMINGIEEYIRMTNPEKDERSLRNPVDDS